VQCTAYPAIKWNELVTSDSVSVRELTKLVDLPVIVADRRRALLGEVSCRPDDTPAHVAIRHWVDAQGLRTTPTWKRPPGRRRDLGYRASLDGPRLHVQLERSGRGHMIGTTSSIPRHADFHAAPLNSPFAAEFAACREKKAELPVFATFIH